MLSRVVCSLVSLSVVMLAPLNVESSEPLLRKAVSQIAQPADSLRQIRFMRGELVAASSTDLLNCACG